jgi:hypothetical protein
VGGVWRAITRMMVMRIVVLSPHQQQLQWVAHFSSFSPTGVFSSPPQQGHISEGPQRVLYRTVRCRQSRDSWQKDTAPTRRSVGNGQRDHRMLTQTGRIVTRPYEQREPRRQHVRLEPDISPHRAGYSEALCKLFHILFWREFVNQPVQSACKRLKSEVKVSHHVW